MVLGGMVAIMPIFVWVIGRVLSLWLIMMMVVASWFVWATIRAHWIDVIIVLRSGGWARQLPLHFDEWRGRLIQILYVYCVSVIGQVRGEE